MMAGSLRAAMPMLAKAGPGLRSLEGCLVTLAGRPLCLMLNLDRQACQAETAQADDAGEDKNYPPQDWEDR